MPKSSIANLFHIKNRFLRSTHLERDFGDPGSLEGYILTDEMRGNLERLARGLNPRSGQRAWRVTGDYGTGKSSFGLVLAHLFAGRSNGLPAQIRKAVDFAQFGTETPRLLPVLVTGSREPLARAVLRGLHAALIATCERGRRPSVLERVRSQTDQGNVPTDGSVIALIEETIEYLASSGKGNGVLLILDEMGKFLEYAALHPDRQDVYFLQRLAERASRSGEAPLFVVGVLHQGFDAYADKLPEPARKEWEKVAGRFDELVFKQPLEQTTRLIANALGVRVAKLPREVIDVVRRDMRAAIALEWFGPAFGRSDLLDLAESLYPLHPTVLPVLVRLFARFGQNERSLFSFLFSTEPFGLQSFAQREIGPGSVYRLSDLYDYARATFGHRLSQQSYRSHWNHIESLIDSYRSGSDHELAILKTVGLLNLLGDNSLLASERLLKLAVTGASLPNRKFTESIKTLESVKGVVYFRGKAGGYCLWPHTSVNLEAIYRRASLEVAPVQRISEVVGKYVESRPLVARRHYIETGNLRHFCVHYVAVSELGRTVDATGQEADGHIIVALCETPHERDDAIAFATTAALRNRPNLLVAVPQPLTSLGGLLSETHRWQWIAQNTPELMNDTYAAEEVSRQIASANQVLERRIRDYVGLRRHGGQTELEWFRQGRAMTIPGGRELLSLLSSVCDEVYCQAPRVMNELVNRRSLSSAAAAARMRLIERVLKYSTEPLLGMDPTKKPPEMSMYLSIIKGGGFHVNHKKKFVFREPTPDADSLRMLPALRCIRDVLDRTPDRRINVARIFDELRLPPYGVRDGLIPLLLAAFAVVHERDLAFYENGVFLRHVNGPEFQRLAKGPETFEMQYCVLEGVRSDLFERLLDVLGLHYSRPRRADVLDVVRPLCIFAAQLPAFTHRTKGLSADVEAIRTALLATKEPATLLFKDLPRACGFEPFGRDTPGTDLEVQRFVGRLKECLDELKRAYPNLLDRLRTAVTQEFALSATLEVARAQLATRAEQVLLTITEPRLKAFCLRLNDANLAETEWLESIGSFLSAKPPSKWLDADEESFGVGLHELAGKFLRAESLAFLNRAGAPSGTALRLSVMRGDGSEIDRVFHVQEDQEASVAKVEAYITELLAKDPQIGLIAATRAVWAVLSMIEEKN